MTPPDAATPTRPARASRGGTRRRAPSRPSRRVSGPSRGVGAARTAVPVPAGAVPGSAAAAPPLALRLARAGARIGDARLLDRLVRGRGWIALVAVGLMGIVFVQVSMLRLNAGISRAVAGAETLERQNSILRADISKLDAGARISDTAAALGMVRPPAGEVNYLDARKADGRAAAKGIRAPQPVKATGSPQAAATQAAATQAAATQAAGTQAAGTQAQAATAQATTSAPAQSAAAPTQTTTPAPASAAQAATQPPAETQTAAAAQPQPHAAPTQTQTQTQATASPQQQAAAPAATTATPTEAP